MSGECLAEGWRGGGGGGGMGSDGQELIPAVPAAEPGTAPAGAAQGDTRHSMRDRCSQRRCRRPAGEGLPALPHPARALGWDRDPDPYPGIPTPVPCSRRIGAGLPRTAEPHSHAGRVSVPIPCPPPLPPLLLPSGKAHLSLAGAAHPAVIPSLCLGVTAWAAWAGAWMSPPINPASALPAASRKPSRNSGELSKSK